MQYLVHANNMLIFIFITLYTLQNLIFPCNSKKSRGNVHNHEFYYYLYSIHYMCFYASSIIKIKSLIAFAISIILLISL